MKLRTFVPLVMAMVLGCHHDEIVVEPTVIETPPAAQIVPPPTQPPSAVVPDANPQTTQQPVKDLLPKKDADIPGEIHIPAKGTPNGK